MHPPHLIGVAIALAMAIGSAPADEPKSKPAEPGEVARADASSNGLPPVVNEGVVKGPVEEVWRAFTTKEGLESWMAAHVQIDLRVGGKMLTRYDSEGVIGDAGTIENTILSYEPLHMFSIKATKPPESFPFKRALESMWTVVYFDAESATTTRVRCVSLGFQDDDESRQMRGFFAQGNAWTLAKIQQKFDPSAPVPGSAHGGPKQDVAPAFQPVTEN